MRVRLAMAAVGAIGALLLVCTAAPRAEAMAMYNNSTYYEGGTEVRFVCGIFCGWTGKTMPYHEQIAYPGKGGSFTLLQDGCIMSSGAPDIESHGYAVLSGADLNADSDGIEWTMWGNAENLISGSPFDVLCLPEPSSRQVPATAAGSSLARRASRPTWIARQFRSWDTDGSGTLSDRELRAGSMRDFRQIDLDGDGVVDAADVRLDLHGTPGSRRGRVGRTVLPFDLDHDGEVGPSEYWRYVRRSLVDPIRKGRRGPLTLSRVEAYYETSP
ncbi:MAG TPA: hypothetical protein VHO06_05110 [Polyangia bacterium]|nr:hypothetical protein [Polyangia bacterium]